MIEVACADHRWIPPFHLPRQGGDGGQGGKIRLIKQAPCQRGQAAGGQPLLPRLPLIKLVGRVSPPAFERGIGQQGRHKAEPGRLSHDLLHPRFILWQGGREAADPEFGEPLQIAVTGLGDLLF